MYFIITKTTFEEGQIKHITQGHTENKTLAETLCSGYSEMKAWNEENREELENGTKTMEEFFSINSDIYQILAETNSIEGLELIELT